MRECKFEELPEKLQIRVNNLKTSKVIRCLYDDKNYAECIVKDGSLIGLFHHSYGDVDSVWLCGSDIEFLHNAL